MQLESSALDVLARMLQYFAGKLYLHFQAQGLSDSVLLHAYSAGKMDFIKTIKVILFFEDLNNANIIAIFAVYKGKTSGDRSLEPKTRVALHRNENCSRLLPSSKYSMRSPTRLRTIALITTLSKWRATKIDVKRLFCRLAGTT